ncbi:MAG: hypothetical protein ACKVT1_16395 [Dehalococcoidia bacterium]
MAGRYRAAPPWASPAEGVHLLQPCPAAAISHRTTLQVARTWAPQLHFTLMTPRDAAPLATGPSAAGPGAKREPAGPAVGGPALALRLSRSAAVASVPAALQGHAVTPPLAATLAVRRPRIELATVRQAASTERGQAPVTLPAAARAVPMVLVAPRGAGAPSAPSHPAGNGPPAGWPAAPHGDMSPAPPRTAMTAASAIADDPVAMGRIADTVMLQIDRRLQAYRERTGRA